MLLLVYMALKMNLSGSSDSVPMRKMLHLYTCRIFMVFQWVLDIFRHYLRFFSSDGSTCNIFLFNFFPRVYLTLTLNITQQWQIILNKTPLTAALSSASPTSLSISSCCWTEFALLKETKQKYYTYLHTFSWETFGGNYLVIPSPSDCQLLSIPSFFRNV